MAFSAENFIASLALVGVVIMATSLMSGMVERANVPQIAVFLLLGATLGPPALGIVDVNLDSSMLRVVATLGLALVLFSDAVTLNISETRKNFRLASIILVPGTLLSAALVAVAGRFILGLDWPSAFVIAAALASTDPVMLRGLLRRKDIPRNARLALRLESGLNDIVLLPVLLIAMVFAAGASEERSMGGLLFSLFVLGPGAGAAVGLVSIGMLKLARERIGIRRDYESFLSLGICFAAYAAAEAMHGSGFLAAFAAGLMISAFDDDLCDCFIEYGETTAEMLLMFTFVLLGSGLIWSGIGALTVPVAIFVVLAMAARPLALIIALFREKMDAKSKRLIVWMGPRGLSTLLLALIPAFERMPGAEVLFGVCGLTVLFSVVVHGGSIMLMGNRKPSGASLDMLRMSPRVPVDDLDVLIGIDQVTPQMKLADVRSARDFESSELALVHSVRLDPDDPVQSAQRAGFHPQDWIALFCT